MKKKRFSEAEIIKTIQELDAGKEVIAICRELGIHKATRYNWRKEVWRHGCQSAGPI